MECGALPGFRLDPDAAPMPFYDLFTNGKSNACAGIIATGMQALEDEKDTFEVLRFDAYAIIAYTEKPGI